MEHICHKNHIDFVVQNTSKEKSVKDELEYVKLHGCVNAPDEPFIFSKTEYDNLISSRLNFKHNKLIQIFRMKTLFLLGQVWMNEISIII